MRKIVRTPFADKSAEPGKLRYHIHSSIIKILFLLIFICGSFLLNGCSDMIEIQDRDFVLALGVSYEDGQYELTYALPDLGAVTGEGTGENGRLMRTYKGETFQEIENTYNLNGSNRLDYRHLQAIVLDESISLNQDNMRMFAEYIDENNEISRNVLLFYTPGSAIDLLEAGGESTGNIGIFLNKMDRNNKEKHGNTSMTAGQLIDSQTHDKVLFVPILKTENGSLIMDGAAIFRETLYLKEVSEEDLIIYYLLQGKGSEYILNIDDVFTAEIKDIKSKAKYSLQNGTPSIDFDISGSAAALSSFDQNTAPDELASELERYLYNRMMNMFEVLLKEDKIDYMNFYNNSSMKNRKIWIRYQDKIDDFMEQLQISIALEMDIQQK